MSAPSRSGWHGWPKEQRICSGCGQPLTLKDAPLWFDEMRRRVYHFAHRFADRGKPEAIRITLDAREIAKQIRKRREGESGDA